MRRLMPPAPADVVDLGCGTGSLAALLAAAGYRVRGLDVSGRMIAAARNKAAAALVDAEFERGDAAAPPYVPGSADVVLELATCCGRCRTRRTQSGRGRGSCGRAVVSCSSRAAGRPAPESPPRATRKALALEHPARGDRRTPRRPPRSWGRAIDDERYALLSRLN